MIIIIVLLTLVNLSRALLFDINRPSSYGVSGREGLISDIRVSGNKLIVGVPGSSPSSKDIIQVVDFNGSSSGEFLYNIEVASPDNNFGFHLHSVDNLLVVGNPAIDATNQLGGFKVFELSDDSFRSIHTEANNALATEGDHVRIVKTSTGGTFVLMSSKDNPNSGLIEVFKRNGDSFTSVFELDYDAGSLCGSTTEFVESNSELFLFVACSEKLIIYKESSKDSGQFAEIQVFDFNMGFAPSSDVSNGRVVFANSDTGHVFTFFKQGSFWALVDTVDSQTAGFGSDLSLMFDEKTGTEFLSLAWFDSRRIQVFAKEDISDREWIPIFSRSQGGFYGAAISSGIINGVPTTYTASSGGIHIVEFRNKVETDPPSNNDGSDSDSGLKTGGAIALGAFVSAILYSTGLYIYNRRLYNVYDVI